MTAANRSPIPDNQPEEWIIERGDPAEIDRLEPLWKSLLEHHKAGLRRPAPALTR